jgi:hypothetical protein
MPLKKIAEIRQEGKFLFLKIPYLAQFLEELKDIIPSEDRAWEKPLWKVRVAYLTQIRKIVYGLGKQEDWEVYDLTAETEEELHAHQREVEQQEIEGHVAAICTVLNKLPRRALRLVSWKEGILDLELSRFLDDKELFLELAQASLHSYRPSILFGGSKREGTQTFLFKEEPRILRALCTYAGSLTPTQNRFASDVEHLVVRTGLFLLHRFDDMIVHLESVEHVLWVGIPYQRILDDLTYARDHWEVQWIEDTLYRLFPVEETLEKLLAVAESQYVNPGVGFAVAQRHPSQVAQVVAFMHIGAWFREWGNARVQSMTLTQRFRDDTPCWHTHDWEHPADLLLSHLSWTRSGGPTMALLLGWTQDDIPVFRQRIRALKEQKVAQVLEEMVTHAAELALPLLEARTISDLLALGERHTLELRKSWSKAKIVGVLNTYTPINEEILGLTTRFAEETHA